MRRIKIPLYIFPLKMQGGLCARGAYLRDTTVLQSSKAMSSIGSNILSSHRICPRYD